MSTLPILATLSGNDLDSVSEQTLGHYNGRAVDFWEGTRDHDVSQNIDALIRNLAPCDETHRILDFGCGPGRDLIAFRDLGYQAIGLDGAAEFARLARSNSGCEVLHQSFLALDLKPAHFDGVFANASMFHVPSQELARVLGDLAAALRPSGVLFSSNPHGPNIEGWSGNRYNCYLDLETYTQFMGAAGFAMVEHYYRPSGKPRAQQPWLASLWEKS